MNRKMLVFLILMLSFLSSVPVNAAITFDDGVMEFVDGKLVIRSEKGVIIEECEFTNSTIRIVTDGTVSISYCNFSLPHCDGPILNITKPEIPEEPEEPAGIDWGSIRFYDNSSTTPELQTSEPQTGQIKVDVYETTVYYLLGRPGISKKVVKEPLEDAWVSVDEVGSLSWYSDYGYGPFLSEELETGKYEVYVAVNHNVLYEGIVEVKCNEVTSIIIELERNGNLIEFGKFVDKHWFEGTCILIGLGAGLMICLVKHRLKNRNT